MRYVNTCKSTCEFINEIVHLRGQLFYVCSKDRFISDSARLTVALCSRAQSTVDFPIGGHVNVLSDYKETGPEKKIKFYHNHCSHVTDMLIKFRQKSIYQALLKCMHVF